MYIVGRRERFQGFADSDERSRAESQECGWASAGGDAGRGGGGAKAADRLHPSWSLNYDRSCILYIHYGIRSRCFLISYYRFAVGIRLHYDRAGGERVEEAGVISGARQEVPTTSPAKASQRAAAGSGKLDRRLVHAYIHILHYIMCRRDRTLISSCQPSGSGPILCHGEE